MINLYYDNYPVGNGYSDLSMGVAKDITITDHLFWVDLAHNILSPKEYKENKNLNLYVVELLEVQHLDNIFNEISNESMKLMSEGKLSLLIYFPIEGFGLELYDNWFSKLHHLFEKYSLIGTKKYFVFNNYTIESQYDNIKHSLPCNFEKVFGFPFFHLKYNRLLKEKNEAKDKEVFFNNERNKNYFTNRLQSKFKNLIFVNLIDSTYFMTNILNKKMFLNYIFNHKIKKHSDKYSISIPVWYVKFNNCYVNVEY